MTTTPAPERPERIELRGGLYMRPCSDPFSKEWVMCRADGNLLGVGYSRKDVGEVVAAMAPQQAAPVRTDEVQEILDDLQLVVTNKDMALYSMKTASTILAYIAKLEQQSNTSGAQPAFAISDRDADELEKVLAKTLIAELREACDELVESQSKIIMGKVAREHSHKLSRYETAKRKVDDFLRPANPEESVGK